MYLKNSFLNDKINLNDYSEHDNQFKWENIEEKEIQKVIFTSNSKKACESDNIEFLILQKSYETIKELYLLLYLKLLNNDYHPKCWRTGLGAILRKPNKKNYSLLKSYRIISLLNYLNKIAEKIMTNRISFWSEATESLKNSKALLDFEQMRDRKNHSAVNAVMNLIHDIQLARANNNTVSCVLLDIKEAFDHVSLA